MVFDYTSVVKGGVQHMEVFRVVHAIGGTGYKSGMLKSSVPGT